MTIRFTKALLIGINYTGTRYQLRGCHNDVDNTKNLLITNGTAENDIIVLKEPTRLEILRAFIRFVMLAKCDDKLYLHYSGHGVSMEDKSGDERDGKDELIFTADFKTISDDELNRYLVSCLPPGTKLFSVFDCCHSGTILDLKYSIYVKDNQFTINNEGNYSCKNGQVVSLSGSLDHQYAADASLKNTYQGALTYCFIETINELGGFGDFLEITKLVNKKLVEYGFTMQESILTTNSLTF